MILHGKLDVLDTVGPTTNYTKIVANFTEGENEQLEAQYLRKLFNCNRMSWINDLKRPTLRSSLTKNGIKNL